MIDNNEIPGLTAGRASHLTTPSVRSRYRAVASATIGSIIEGFDFIAYGIAAALIFNKQFFPTMDPTAATLASFGTFATGLFARPLGALVFGHFGDRLGRKSMLVLSLFLMGFSTIAIGLVPNFSAIGMWSAALLVSLRILQGFALGGEMGGAVLMAVEHAPKRHAGFFGSLPQIGPPIGLLLATSAFAALSRMPEDAFQCWGWRLPFLASIVLVVLGSLIRRGVDESPEFKVHVRIEPAKAPIIQLLQSHSGDLLKAIGAKLPEVTLYYLLTVFLLSYAPTVLGFKKSLVLDAIMGGAFLQIFMVPLCGWLADRVGVRRFYACGALLMALTVPTLLHWIETGGERGLSWGVALAVGVVYSALFGPQSALLSAQFPVHLRFTGISVGIQFAAAIGGGLAPLIATTVVAYYGSLSPIAWYICTLAVIAFFCTMRMKNVGAKFSEGN